MLASIANYAVFAQAEGGGEEEGGSFLVSPDVGLMIWTLLVFGLSMYLLGKLAFPRIAEALDRRQKAIEDSIDTAEQIRKEADEILAEARAKREEMMEQTRRDIEAETRRAIQEIRAEVADLTVLATEKVTRKTLTDADHKRLVEEALSELDFASLSGEERGWKRSPWST